MERMPVRFKRVAIAFDDQVAKARLCESSGSEHSAEGESLADLSDLVNSFLERDYGEERESELEVEEDEGQEDEDEGHFSDFERIKNALRSLLGNQEGGIDVVNRDIHEAVEKACREIGSHWSTDFKRRLMTRLRDRGFDAGLCKSKWEKNGGCPSGEYDYIDVNVAETRYIVEVHLAGEFEIARPTGSYASLLEDFPSIFVGKVEELKGVVKQMCRAIRRSMKSNDIHVPPWRRHSYMQAKWFGSYKRTINSIPARKAYGSRDESSKRRSVGFMPLQLVSSHCREDFPAARIGRKVGNLTAAFGGL